MCSDKSAHFDTNTLTPKAANQNTRACQSKTGRARIHAALSAIPALLLVGSASGVRAQGIGVTVNGQPVQFQDIGPQQVEGRTLVPVRGVLEKLGANVSYLPQTQTVVASTPKMDIQLKIGSKTAVVNGNNVTLDVPAQEIHDHTFVPLRFLGEALGADVAWDAPTRTVRILTKDALNVGTRPTAPPQTSPSPRKSPIAPGPAPLIRAVRVAASAWLRGGASLRVTLDGTAGGQAAFRLPGVIENVPMREASSGHYVGAWQVPAGQGLTSGATAVFGLLKVGNRTAPQIQADQTVAVDTVPPAIRTRTPDEAARVREPRPLISAILEDAGSGIDTKSTRLLLNGLDVTAEARITREAVSYQPAAPLPPGPQTVELRVQDAAGNRAIARWTFSEAGGSGTERNADGIRSVINNATRPLLPGDTLLVEVNGMPGCRVTFSVGTIQNITLREEQPGHYVCSYTIRRGDVAADKPILFRLQTPNGQRFQRSSPNAVRIRADRPAFP